jgi:conjugal transfer ATP-binding protein TraC
VNAMLLLDSILGTKGALNINRFHRLLERDQLSNYLPYQAWDREKEIYHNMDDTVGYVWECTPLVYAGADVFETLKGCVNAGIPSGSVLQFMMYADPHIDGHFSYYRSLKVRQNPFLDTLTDAMIGHFSDAEFGLKSTNDIPVRNFRLFVSLKFPPGESLIDQYEFAAMSVAESLKGVGLNPVPMAPEALIILLSRMLNTNENAKPAAYDDGMDIKKQILSAGTIDVKFGRVEISDGKGNTKYLKPQTVKGWPVNEIDPMTMNRVMGGIMGNIDDTNQINCPFWVAVNIVFQGLSKRIRSKTELMMRQEKRGVRGQKESERETEYRWAAKELISGNLFVRVIPIIWNVGRTKEEVDTNCALIGRIWHSQGGGFVLQEDMGILTPLFIASLPMGLYNLGTTVDFLDRDKIMPAETAVRLLPVQGDFTGSGQPTALFLGRKGQLISCGMFNEGSTNNNVVVAATTGAGKSYLMNYLLKEIYSNGGLIRIFDLGRSYEKLAKILGGTFIEFTENSHVSLNPFTNIRNINDSIDSLSAILYQMCYSATGELPSETQMRILKNTARAAWEIEGNDAGIDTIYRFLNRFTEVSNRLESGIDLKKIKDIDSKSAELGFNLKDFTTKGPYGKWFAGPATLDISKDEFVVLEVDSLKDMDSLFRVVCMQIIHYITQNLYLSDRKQPRVIVFEETAQWVNKDSFIAMVIESGYRLARKYYGSFITVLQSPLDIENFGRVGRVINSNSAYKFYLQSRDYPQALEEKVIDYNPFMASILNSVRLVKPKYSEFLMETPNGTGVARLSLDPTAYYAFTSDPQDNARITALLEEGNAYHEAIQKLAAARGY